MAMINIRRDVDDKFYRYKMPVLTTKIEGKGNGIKTVVPNMADIARSLARPPAYPTKYFGIELGAQVKLDDKTERYIVSGAHDANRLRELLDGFIVKFVLCGSCKNPETFYIITKSEDVVRDCKACGARSDVDPRHKLTTYIVKNPPPAPKKVKGLKTGAETSTAANAEAIMGISSGGPNVGGGEEDGADGQANAEVDESEIPGVMDRPEGDDDDWAVDVSPEAVKAREAELSKQLKNSMILGGQDAEDDDDEGDAYGEFKAWIVATKADGGALTSETILGKAQELGIAKKHKAVLVVSEALFGENADKDIPKYGKLFKTIVRDEKHQKALLGGVERLCGVHYPSLLETGGVSKILMAYYQLDVLDEDIAKHWGTHVSKKYTDKETSKSVRLGAKKFLEWLDEAEESDSDDE